MKISVEERFWSKVNKTGTCWLWIASCFPSGYGRFNFEGTMMHASRVSWILSNGYLRQDQFVCHKCDNPSCVRLNHLWVGTQIENLNDMTNKGRRKIGEQHGSAKLIKTQVLEIRNKYKQGGVTYSDLGKLFGMSSPAIGHIIRGYSWSKA